MEQEGRELVALGAVLIGFPISLALACGVFSLFSSLSLDGGAAAGYRWAFLIVGAGFVGCAWMVHRLTEGEGN